MNSLRLLLSIILTVALGACKARQHDEAGLLSFGSENSNEETVALGGNYSLLCIPDNKASTDASESFLVTVKGAENPKDEAQPILVTIDVARSGQEDRLFTDSKGRGAIARDRSIFLGFETGVLTAELSTAEPGSETFIGVISIASFTDGAQVKCQVRELVASVASAIAGVSKKERIQSTIHPEIGTWEIEATLNPIEGLEDTFEVEKIQIRNGKKLVQELGPVGDAWREEDKRHGLLLEIRDFNADGYQDLQVRTTCGNKRCALDVFLFDRKTKQFTKK